MENIKTQIAETPQNSVSNGSEAWLTLVRSQLGSLSFGVIQLTIHNSEVVQVERTEKLRLSTPKPTSSGSDLIQRG